MEVGRKRRLAMMAGAVGVAVMWAGVGGGSTAVATNSRWSVGPCNVGPAARGLWEDAPGAGPNVESAYFWVSNVVAGDERCTWEAPVGGIYSGSFPSMQIRLALNDSAEVIVRAHNAGGVVIAGTAAFVANSGFQVVNVALPPEQFVGKVSVTLHDAPDGAVVSTRSSVLVDYVKIWNPGSGAVGWVEQFHPAG